MSIEITKENVILNKKEAIKYYKGNVYVPYDREIIELK